MMNEEAGNIKVLNDFGILVTGILLSTDLATGNVYWYHTNIGNKGYGYFDPVADYANTNMGDIKWVLYRRQFRSRMECHPDFHDVPGRQ